MAIFSAVRAIWASRDFPGIASTYIYTPVQASRHGLDAKLSKPLGLEKGQNVGIDNIGMNRKHAVRVPRIDLESRVLDQLRLK